MSALKKRRKYFFHIMKEFLDLFTNVELLNKNASVIFYFGQILKKTIHLRADRKGWTISFRLNLKSHDNL